MSDETKNRRAVQRLRFEKAIEGRLRARKVDLLDLSVNGAGIRHHFALTRGSNALLEVEWEQQKIRLFCVVTRCGLTGYTEGNQGVPIYQSGLRFVESEESDREALIRLVQAYIEKALAEGRQMADGTLPVTIGNAPIMAWLMNKLK